MIHGCKTRASEVLEMVGGEELQSCHCMERRRGKAKNRFEKYLAYLEKKRERKIHHWKKRKTRRHHCFAPHEQFPVTMFADYPKNIPLAISQFAWKEK